MRKREGPQGPSFLCVLDETLSSAFDREIPERVFDPRSLDVSFQSGQNCPYTRCKSRVRGGESQGLHKDAPNGFGKPNFRYQSYDQSPCGPPYLTKSIHRSKILFMTHENGPSADLSKTRYFSRLALSHKNALLPHWHEGETLGKKDDPEIWRNVGKHCLVAGAFANLLARKLGLPVEEIRDVTEAALLHDWYKKHETLARKRAITVVEIRDLIQHEKEKDCRILREQYGFRERVVRLTGANLPTDARGPETLSERILWYVDAMLTDTEPMRIRQRFDDLENHPERGESNRAFSESYRPVYGGISLYELQRQLGDAIGKEFATLLGYQGDPEDLPFFLKSLLEEEIRKEAIPL